MNSRQQYLDKFNDGEGPRSVYDEEDSDAELWFLPDPGTTLVDHETPLPQADNTPLNNVCAWLLAQGQHAAGLAKAAMAVGQLDMLVAEMGQGALERLAMREVEALMWMAGMPIALDEIGRDRLQARAGTNLEGLQTARWAVRRLIGGRTLDDLREFLGLHRGSQTEGLQETKLRLTGREFDEAAAEFHTARAETSDAHCFVQAAYERHLWCLADLSPEQDQIEAAVWASLRLASECSVLTFVPIGQAAQQFRGTNPEELGRYLAAITQGAVGAKAELLRVRSWAKAARKATAKIKGETLGRIIDALLVKPMCSTEMVEQYAGVSRDTAERALKRLHDLGVVREVTGRTRFRLWSAKV